MATICDNCGKQKPVLQLCYAEAFFTKAVIPIIKIGEYCDECLKKIEARVREGVN